MMTLMVKMMLVWWNKYVIGDDGNPVLMVIPMMISMTIIVISYQGLFNDFLPAKANEWRFLPCDRLEIVIIRIIVIIGMILIVIVIIRMIIVMMMIIVVMMIIITMMIIFKM